MNKYLVLILGMLMVLSLQAQIEQASLGAGYVSQEFYNLETSESLVVPHEAWDLAFTTSGFQDAGIILNEAASLGGSEIELYAAPTNDFEDDINVDDLTERLYNDETSWEAGAFNEFNPMNPFNYGWGVYDPAAMTVVGQKVFAMKMRDGSYIKFTIESLAITAYNLKFADLDGSNERTFSFDKNQFPNVELAFFSFADNEVKEMVDFQWDLVFTRYTTLAPTPDGSDTLQYVLTGVLSGIDTEVAEARGVDPATVAYEDYKDQLETSLDVIGYDWKAINFMNYAWSVADDLAYFVKTAQGDVYKLVFLDFEGSSTGTITFEKTLVTTTSSEDLQALKASLSSAYPNPNNGTFFIDINNQNDFDQAHINIYNAVGKSIHQENRSLIKGNQQLAFDFNIPNGQYFWTITIGNEILSQLILIQD